MMMGIASGPAWAGKAIAAVGLMSTAVDAFLYNETLDPWNMNKNQGESLHISRRSIWYMLWSRS